MASRVQILSLYKALMRESGKFDNYNYRSYALRRIRDGFKKNINLTDPILLKKEVAIARDNLEIIKRQVIIGKMYGTEKLVIENVK